LDSEILIRVWRWALGEQLFGPAARVFGPLFVDLCYVLARIGQHNDGAWQNLHHSTRHGKDLFFATVTHDEFAEC
jgi:hypothetical protein